MHILAFHGSNDCLAPQLPSFHSGNALTDFASISRCCSPHLFRYCSMWLCVIVFVVDTILVGALFYMLVMRLVFIPKNKNNEFIDNLLSKNATTKIPFTWYGHCVGFFSIWINDYHIESHRFRINWSMKYSNAFYHNQLVTHNGALSIFSAHSQYNRLTDHTHQFKINAIRICASVPNG